MQRKLTLAALGFIIIAAQRAAHAAPVTLYDGTQPGLPQTQGWLAYKDVPGTATTSLNAGAGPTTLDTTAGGSNTEQAGFSNYQISNTFAYSLYNASFPTLSPTTGFDLNFDMELLNESHTGSTDRAGFSVILLGSNDYGVELGFWQGQIFAQSSTFTHTVETTTGFDPTTAYYDYDLSIQNGTYTLLANGKQILTGPTRNYSQNALGFPYNIPYTTPNFVFLGDDTQAAEGISAIQSVSIAVPEPTTATLLVGVTGLLLGRRGRGNRTASAIPTPSANAAAKTIRGE